MPPKTTKKAKAKSASSRSKSKDKDLVLPDFTKYFFLIAVVAILILFAWVISPFFNVLIYSALIAIIFYPVHDWLVRHLKGQKSISAFLTTLLVMVLFLAPLTLFFIFIAQEAIIAFDVLEEQLSQVDFGEIALLNFEGIPYVGERLQALSEQIAFKEWWDSTDLDLIGLTRDIGESISSFIVAQTGVVLKSFGDFMLGLFILLLTVFFFFRDGDEVVRYLKEISPLPPRHENEIEQKLKESTYGVVVGNLGTALIQGFAGGVGFAIVGIENAMLWGTVMVLMSLVPYVGATIVWGPVALFLIFQGSNVAGIFLLLWGMFVVATVDNVARPFLIGSQTKMHPLPTFLVVIGGILVFGLKGIIFGPLILSLTLTIVHIYQLEYKEVLKS
jgi:predicted PurR-regulated permease PerM